MSDDVVFVYSLLRDLSGVAALGMFMSYFPSAYLGYLWWCVPKTWFSIMCHLAGFYYLGPHVKFLCPVLGVLQHLPWMVYENGLWCVRVVCDACLQIAIETRIAWRVFRDPAAVFSWRDHFVLEFAPTRVLVNDPVLEAVRIMRRFRSVPAPVPQPEEVDADPDVQSDLNGSHGEATETDDHVKAKAGGAAVAKIDRLLQQVRGAMQVEDGDDRVKKRGKKVNIPKERPVALRQPEVPQPDNLAAPIPDAPFPPLAPPITPNDGFDYSVGRAYIFHKRPKGSFLERLTNFVAAMFIWLPQMPIIAQLLGHVHNIIMGVNIWVQEHPIPDPDNATIPRLGRLKLARSNAQELVAGLEIPFPEFVRVFIYGTAVRSNIMLSQGYTHVEDLELYPRVVTEILAERSGSALTELNFGFFLDATCKRHFTRECQDHGVEYSRLLHSVTHAFQLLQLKSDFVRYHYASAGEGIFKNSLSSM